MFVGVLLISYNNIYTYLFCVLVSAKQATADKRILKRFKAFYLNLDIVYLPTYKSAPKRIISRSFALSYVLPVILHCYPLSYLPTYNNGKKIYLCKLL